MRLYVNIYAVGQGYGGPEEGGWWFDTGQPIGSIPVELTEQEFEDTRTWFSLNHGDDDDRWDLELWGKFLTTTVEDKARKVQESYARQYPNTRKRYSVNGGDDYAVVIEEHFARAYPTERPTYE